MSVRLRLGYTCAIGLLTGCFGETFSLDGLGSLQDGEAGAATTMDRNGDARREDGSGYASDDGGGAPPDGKSTDSDVHALFQQSPSIVPDLRVRDAMLAADGPDARKSSESTIDSGSGESSASQSGSVDASEDGFALVGDLSNIGTADFHITLTVTTTQMALTALVNQRAICSFAPFWDIRVVNGALLIETCDAVFRYTEVTTYGPLVNDGKPHHLTVERMAQRLTAYIDGIASGSAASTSSFGQLAPISNKDPCETTGQYGPFLGSISDLRVASP